jgi:hypothetical protein
MAPLPLASDLTDADLTPALKRKLKRNLDDFAALKHRETAALDRLRDRVSPDTRLIAAPDLGREPRTLADLTEIARNLQSR